MTASLYDQATELRREGKYEEARELFHRITKADPGNAAAWNDIGRCLAGLKRKEEAIEAYRRAVEANPAYAGSIRNIGVLLHQMNRDAEAAEAFREAVRIKPGYASAYNNLGASLERLGDREGAFRAYGKACELNPRDARAHRNLGGIVMGAGRLAEAVIHFRRAIRIVVEEKRPIRWRHNQQRIRGFSHGRAEEALFRAKAVFEGADVPFFLCFGTLLGHVREGGFLTHDSDIDVGIPQGSDCVALARAFEGAGFHLTQRRLWPTLLSDGISRIPIKCDNGISIDVYPHIEEGDRTWCCIGRGANELRWEFTRFGTARARFLDGEFRVPDDVERYLVEGYGPDWRIPDPYFEGTFTAPNIPGGHPPVARAYAHYFIACSLIDGKWERAWNFLTQVTERDPDDPFAWEMLEAFAEETATEETGD